MRRKRAKATAAFAAAKNLDTKAGWRWRLMRFGERLFGHGSARPTKYVNPVEEEELQLMKMRHAEEERHLMEMKKLGGPSSLPSYYDFKHERDELRSASSHSRPSSYYPPGYRDNDHLSPSHTESLYSQVTGMPRRSPDARQPVKDLAPPRMGSRFSWTTHDSESLRRRSPESLAPAPTSLVTEAQQYAQRVRTPDGGSTGSAERATYWLEPTNTGASKNPFRR